MLTDNQPGHIDHIRQINAGTVYRLIDQYGPLSRIELAKRTKLAPASITKIIREMLQADLIRECEITEPGNRGRPATGLELCSQRWRFLAMHLSDHCLRITLRDLGGGKITERVQPLPAGSETSLAGVLAAAAEDFLCCYPLLPSQLAALAVTLPGMVNSNSGVIPNRSDCQQPDIPLSAMLHQRTGLNVYVQNVISARVLAEHYFGAATDCRDVILVVSDQQTEAAVITGGELLHQNRCSRVDIGHTCIDPDGSLCDCGNSGCLNTLASTESLLEQARQQIAEYPDSLLHQSPSAITDIRELCIAALCGDTLASGIITRAGHVIGYSLAMMVNIFNPQQILIDSPLNTAAEILFPAIKSRIEKAALPAYSRQVSIRQAALVRPGTLACTALVKDALYRGELLVKLFAG
ncbi:MULTISPECIES: ROK family transcriptional regulator [Tatumella]|uniref:ROK family protein n=1 Tax=Tatumella punctata TaxID=399969 RepID=A0ABW1VLX6_9GAMM|nr:ROK family transcriptional regulator [Tatumella sp. JGM16]MBS0876207.1 ROK family transcriptional regulator [Tatumella sp. JGM82]MBS0889256.1 ROK family transcriptional regulator [Tatumella sp. JGM94]MBS0902330.1 ROK family transcriptional regulator [Tatumella sp. JGM100]MBS0911469.1 ROK family transcriptional regulator [Tatumella sp. JGM91]